MTLRTTFLLCTLALPVYACSHALSDYAPKASGVNQNGKTVDFNELYFDNDWVLVCFFPNSFAPGTQKQMNNLRDAYPMLRNRGVAVLAISSEPPETLLTMKQTSQLPFDLVSDTKQEIAKAYGVPFSLGYNKRTTFLIRNAKIIWIDCTTSSYDQAQRVITYLNERNVPFKREPQLPE